MRQGPVRFSVIDSRIHIIDVLFIKPLAHTLQCLAEAYKME